MADHFLERADQVDAQLLAALQEDGRLSIAELSRRVHMSNSAVAERIRRLEDRGIIRGYRANVDPEKLGYPILAYLRLRYPSSNYKPLNDVLDVTPEAVEAHHVTGDDCFVIKVVATSMRDLERISGRIGSLGSITTSVAYSSPVPTRVILPPGLPNQTDHRASNRQPDDVQGLYPRFTLGNIPDLPATS